MKNPTLLWNTYEATVITRDFAESRHGRDSVEWREAHAEMKKVQAQLVSELSAAIRQLSRVDDDEPPTLRRIPGKNVYQGRVV